ncbi:RHS repeat-associated core domain-containing protein [Actinokineospora guangxiensis]|uniref:RHS repeat-associated core domain-containing protein n=1 Tax=Actinokineospora guangxiensis TaxID=1490288 RepID=A0ABW0ET22_9PSEU
MAAAEVKLPELQREKSISGQPVAVKPLEPTPVGKEWQNEQVRWPSAGTANFDLATVRPGQQAQSDRVPVAIGSVRAAKSKDGQPQRARISVKDQPTAQRAGVTGVLFGVARTDGVRSPGRLSVEVDYSQFRHAVGGDWSTRLRLISLPSCALTSPERPECTRGTPLPTRNDSKNHTLTAAVPVAAAGESVVAAAAGPSGSGGTYSASSLAPSGSWSAGGSSGDFGWSYPIKVPPSLGGPSPQIGLGYSSGSVDGRQVSTNNQPSWVGDGWDYWPGYVERRYQACSEDMTGDHNNTVKTGDQCWFTENATLSLNGRTTELVRDDATGAWRPANDDGSRVERLSGASNGDNDGEYWKVTTVDGTQYFFGRNRLPNWTTDKPETGSTWTVPVFGNNSGEPCRGASFASSWCQQGWRWNLDHVVDPRGNSMSYFYAKETNHYGLNVKTAPVAYTRGGHLLRVEYGQRNGSEYAGAAPAKIEFIAAERCTSANPSVDCTDANFTTANAARWPDVPVDQNCKSTEQCTNRFSPTFWTRKRLAAINTFVRKSDDTGYRQVDGWALTHQFPLTGDVSTPSLWLAKITRTGFAGGTQAMAPVTFQGEQMENRVDAFENLPAINRYRVNAVYTETGSVIGVTYSPKECSRLEPVNMPGPDESNNKRCYPVYWTPEGSLDPIKDYFHKYVAVKVLEQDRTGGQVTKETNYEFVGSPAWAYDHNELAKPERRTWNQYRGYARVRTRVGAAPDPISRAETLYFQGMDGDKLPSGTRNVSVVDSDGHEIADAPEYSGMARETVYYERDGGSVVSSTLNTPWRGSVTATRARPGLASLTSRVTAMAETRSKSRMSDGTWRRAGVVHTYDQYGIPTSVSELGDTATSSDDSCTRFYYTRNTGAWILNATNRIEKVAVSCAATPSRPADVVSETRTFFDGSTTHGAMPTRGDVTRVDELMDWPAGGTARYATTSRTVFDTYGRPIESYDAAGKKSTTSYTRTPATTGLVTTIASTNPLGHVSTKYLDPARGVPTALVDQNNRRTDLSYDPIGRLTQVWLPGRDKATNPTTPNSDFSYQIGPNAPVVVTTKTLKSDGAYRTGHEIYDGLLRLRQTQQPAAGGGRLLTDIFYDTRGLVWKKNAPYYNDQAPSGAILAVGDANVPAQMVYSYDGMGRPTVEAFHSYAVEKRRTTTTYGGEWLAQQPPQGGTTMMTVKDALGRDAELREFHGQAPTGAYDSTKYEYDRKGRLAKVTDSGGRVRSFEYDLRGRQIKAIDPDRGATTMSYNDEDELVTTTDARGETVAYTYDDLGRKTTVRDDSQTGAKRAEWTFDTLADGTAVKGALATSTRYVGTNAYSTAVTGYDAAYRPLGVTATIPASEGALQGSYTFSTTYTATGLPATKKYPAKGGLPSETVTYSYDALELPISIKGLAGQLYLSNTTYGRYGEVLRHQLGGPGKQIYNSYKYEEGTRRLTQVDTDRDVAPTHLETRTWDYDPYGNITSITSQEPGVVADTQCFRLDYLKRMTDAWTATDNCAAEPSTGAGGTVGGPQPYWRSYEFDKVGNRTTEIHHDPSGDPAKNVTNTYAYPAAGQPQSDTLRSVTRTGPDGARQDTFGYDDAGNTTQRNVAGVEQTLEWDAEGHLSKVTKGSSVTEFLYDASGDRLIRREPGATTLYLGGSEYRLDTATATVRGTRYIDAGGATAVRTADGKVNYVLADHHGTGDRAIDGSTLAATRRSSMPFGETRGITPAVWPGSKGFIGGVEDKSTGLTHLGAREYDPELGRFISADPIVDLRDAQQMNGYAYGHNNPVSRSDPSGLYDPEGYDYCQRHRDQCKNRDTPNNGVQLGGGAPPPSNGQSQPAGPSEEKVTWAKKVKEKSLLEVVVEAGGEILMEVLGINDIRNCFTNGDIGACVMMVAGAIPWSKLLEAGDIIGAVWRAGKAVFKWFDEVREADRILDSAAHAAAAAPKLDDVGAVAARQADDVGSAGARQVDDVGGAAGKKADVGDSCVGNSFTPETQVQMADGTSKPISQINLGDEVLATDPETGESGGREVVGLIVGDGYKQLVRITATERTATAVTESGDADGRSTGTVVATDGHPFWVADLKAWLPAKKLKPGMWLHTSTGTRTQITAVEASTKTQRVHNLTVADLHTYHVLAGRDPVLVHNCGGSKPGHAASCDCSAGGTPKPDLDSLASSATTAKGKGPSPAGRAYQKHMNRPGSNLTPAPGRLHNQLGGQMAVDLLTNPRSALQVWTHSIHGPVFDFKLPTVGARWTQSGQFIGFLDP